MKEKNLKLDIMNMINDDKIEKKSKYTFYVMAYLRIFILLILGLIAVFIVSLLGVISRIPAELLMIIVAIIIGLYLMLSNQDLIRKTPRLYVWLITLSALLSIGFILNLIEMHRRIIENTDRGSMMKNMYDRYEPNLYDKWHKDRMAPGLDIMMDMRMK